MGSSGADRSSPRERVGALVMQVLLLGSVVATYTIVRGLVEGSASSAQSNARSILELEEAVGVDIERGWNSYVADRDVLVSFFNLMYQWLYWGSVGVGLGLLWWLDGGTYRRLRNGLFLSALVGVCIFWVFPVAPPRALEGFVDTVHGPLPEPGADPPGGTNVYAAFPSYHVGWPAAMGVVLARFGGRAWVRVAALVPAVLLAVAVIVTANHYVVDVVAGVTISLLCVWFAGPVGRVRRGGLSRRSSCRCRGAGGGWPRRRARRR